MRGKKNTFESIFREHVLVTSGCWIWGAAVGSHGYGQASLYGKRQLVHRLSYEHFKGPIPDGLHVDHLCRVHRCVNPDHLEAVTRRENILRGIAPTAVNSRKVVCIRGHALEGDNLKILSRGERVCRTCALIRETHRERRRKA